MIVFSVMHNTGKWNVFPEFLTSSFLQSQHHLPFNKSLMWLADWFLRN